MHNLGKHVLPGGTPLCPLYECSTPHAARMQQQPKRSRAQRGSQGITAPLALATRRLQGAGSEQQQRSPQHKGQRDEQQVHGTGTQGCLVPQGVCVGGCGMITAPKERSHVLNRIARHRLYYRSSCYPSIRRRSCQWTAPELTVQWAVAELSSPQQVTPWGSAWASVRGRANPPGRLHPTQRQRQGCHRHLIENLREPPQGGVGPQVPHEGCHALRCPLVARLPG